jgi:hypothetical protein
MAVAGGPLAAQTFPTSDPVIKQIYAVGMDSTHLYSLAHSLFDSLGPRLMGSPDLKRAQDWLVKMYQGWGIDAKEERYGTWRGWIRGPSHIDLISPRVRTLQGQMVGYSPGTGGKDVVLSTIILPRFNDSTEFVRWLPQAKGKLVLAAAPKLSCRPQYQWEAMGTPESVRRIDSMQNAVNADWAARIRATGYSMALGGGSLGVRLEDGGAGGLITSRPKLALGGGGRGGFGGGGRGGAGGRGGIAINLNLGNGTATVDSASFAAAMAAARGSGTLGGYGAMEVFETYNTKTPAIALDCEDYGLVYRLTEAGDAPRLRLNLDGKLLGEQPVFNVIASIKGSAHPDEYVMLSAHFDSWDGSSGATDNGTGTLTMLEAMRILKKVYPNPKRTILVGHWSGEEEGEVGSKAFTEDHPEVLKGLQALFNQDNGTGRVVRIGGGGLVHAPEHLNAWLGEIPTEMRAIINGGDPVVAGRPAGGGSDDFSFGCNGLPAFGLGATGWDYGTLTWHTERDTYDKVVFDDLKYNATLTAMLVYEASEDPGRIPLDRVDLAAGGAAGGRGGRGGGSTWPQCEKAPRTTNPRLR